MEHPDLASVRIDKLGIDHYRANYDQYIRPLADRELKLLELGIAKGDSLCFWRDYLPKATVVGLDINRVEVEDETGRIRTYQGEQQDPRMLDGIAQDNAPDGFDVIIDDASHVGQYTRMSFWHLYENHLKPGGLYFIEDWGCSYWDSYPDGKKFVPKPPRYARRERLLNALKDKPWVRRSAMMRKLVGYGRWHGVQRTLPSHQRGMVGFVKQLVDECGIADATNPSFGVGPQRQSRIEWMRVSVGHVIVKKPEAG